MYSIWLLARYIQVSQSLYIGKCCANALNKSTHVKSFRDITTNMIFKIQITGQCDSEILDNGDPG